ncbi:BlaI/MecI/CopY family transcriptional regulator [Stieleria sp. JC731]|uniref:BlaI/MecI/CopY family transcriptional regulator n=1 Tax=Stieleria sp. JC731 TaxID=2894195 RepID=UPI001E632271|nr:BlaI/MecI/CopY family transcriptional regulator [Stieleria sp. JC731]MCC9604020.1 BlaI/MecI/CopY family transcriptional regulator [Stieleria sp. JC731]
MVKPSKDVTAAELAILEKLWEHERATLKQLSKWLYGAETPSDIATVQKLISRLEAKGFVGRDRDCWPHQFCAIVDRDELISNRLQATADELCDGTMGTLLTHLVKSAKFNSRHRKRLRKLLDDLDSE